MPSRTPQVAKLMQPIYEIASNQRMQPRGVLSARALAVAATGMGDTLGKRVIIVTQAAEDILFDIIR